jgi:drug/metabolite transporter (DMT)-like permease
MALLQFVYPASAIAFDALVYGRTLSGIQLAGGALLLASLLVASREKLRA